jgi:hypothetical protein
MSAMGLPISDIGSAFASLAMSADRIARLRGLSTGNAKTLFRLVEQQQGLTGFKYDTTIIVRWFAAWPNQSRSNSVEERKEIGFSGQFSPQPRNNRTSQMGSKTNVDRNQRAVGFDIKADQ